MRSGMPGSQDRLIGRHDQGGVGGGWVICPIFDSRSPGTKDALPNFYYTSRSKISSIARPPEIDPSVEAGVVRVLFIPGLSFYSLETHYKSTEPNWLFKNWVEL